MNVSVAIQHHPARAHLVDTLAARLGAAEIVTDPDPDGPRSPYRTYTEALRRTPDWATHRLIVQDDAQVVDGFPDRMRALLDEHPDRLVAFFVPGAPPHRAAVRRALADGQRWVTLPPTWIPTVALCWPVDLIPSFLQWGLERWPEGVARAGDDGPVGKWAARAGVRAVAPVPSLVQHPDVEPSLIGRRAQAGANRARVAADYAGT